MARRSTRDLLTEAYTLADEHLVTMTAMRGPGAGLPRDVMALDVFLPILEARDRLERKIRRLRRQGRRIETAVAKVQAARDAPVPGRRLVGLSDAGWSRARQAMTVVSGLDGMS